MLSDRQTRAVGLTVGLASLSVLAGVLVIAALALRGAGGPARAAAIVAPPPAPVLAGDQVLGGVRVPAARLARGKQLYDRYCAICHGERGDGMGPSAAFLWPPPRDFRTAQFKFTGTPEGALPDDRDLADIVHQGLRGTAMMPWDVPDSELGPILDHIKSFSPPGRGFRDPGRRAGRAELPPDPTTATDPVAVRAEGARLYHAVFQCNACHPTYATPDELAAWSAQARPDAPLEPVPKWSASYRSVLLPPDFLRHPVRRGRTAGDLARVIAQGMQGPMPGYGHLGAEQVWAVAHYTRWLVELRGTADGDALAGRLSDAWARRAPASTE